MRKDQENKKVQQMSNAAKLVHIATQIPRPALYESFIDFMSKKLPRDQSVHHLASSKQFKAGRPIAGQFGAQSASGQGNDVGANLMMGPANGQSGSVDANLVMVTQGR